MELKEIFDGSKSPSQIINSLKKDILTLPKWEDIKKDYDPLEHEIVNDHIERKDKGNNTAARIHIGLEQLHCKRITEYTFALPVKRVYSNYEGNSTREAICRSIESVFKNARINTENIKRGLAYYASCQFFTLWYAVEKPNSLYGFDSKFKLKCKTFSPMEGSFLYPLFDEYGDLLAMSYEYSRIVEGKKTTYFETFTADKHYKWVHSDSEWKEVGVTPIQIKKIPGVFLNRDYPIFHGLSHIRRELEYTLSRNSDVIAYNAAPVIKIAGEVYGEENKGETQRIYRVENGGDVSYVSWSQANEAVKDHVETITNLYWTQAQMPDISFQKMTSLGQIGYDARKTLFTDAHLKIGDESGPWLECLDREVNVVKAFLAEMNIAYKSEMDNVCVENVITPFIQNDEVEEIEKWMKANGGKPLISQTESISLSGLTQDPAAMKADIDAEEAASVATRMASAFESAI